MDLLTCSSPVPFVNIIKIEARCENIIVGWWNVIRSASICYFGLVLLEFWDNSLHLEWVLECGQFGLLRPALGRGAQEIQFFFDHPVAAVGGWPGDLLVNVISASDIVLQSGQLLCRGIIASISVVTVTNYNKRDTKVKNVQGNEW